MNPYSFFINTNNTIYVPNRTTHRIVIWLAGNITLTRNISVSSVYLFTLFVTSTDDIYVDTYNSAASVTKWISNSTHGIPTMVACGLCYDIFVDVSNTLYCSMGSRHQVVTKSLDSVSDALTIVAGTGSIGSASNMLYKPRGIFVDTNFDLYVADCYNNRIQLFRSGQLLGITVAGQGSANTTIALTLPSDVVVDADKYLFIVDLGNNRIVRSGPNGFYCLVACNGNGSASNQLSFPWSLSFDSYGNMFVSDQLNNRIQQFMLMTNVCSKFNEIQSIFFQSK